MSHCTTPLPSILRQPQQLNFFPNTTPRLNKYTAVISGLLRNIPPKEVFSTNSAFNLAGGVHDNDTLDVYIATKEQAGLRGPTPLSVSYDMNILTSLCDDAKKVLEDEAVVLQIVVGAPASTGGPTVANEADDYELVIVGDIHGQFRDMQESILSVQLDRIKCAEAGVKSEKKDCTFLFLGDYVDRGSQGVEVISLLLALKVEYPDQIYLLRGNHEVAQVCKMYGFLSECQSKLDNNGTTRRRSFSASPVRSSSPISGNGFWSAFNTVFTLLPLGATVELHNREQRNQRGTESGVSANDKPISFFCCHGGFNPHNNHIEAFQFLNRAEYGQGLINSDDSDMIDGLLWSDPKDDDDTDGSVDGSISEELPIGKPVSSPRGKEGSLNIEGYQPSARGCGYIFDIEETVDFCAINDVQLVIRAHQMVMTGYKYCHKGKLLTVFSAPNYCGITNNKGAIAVLKKSQMIDSIIRTDSNDKDDCANNIPFQFMVYDMVPVTRSTIRTYYQTFTNNNDDSCRDKTLEEVQTVVAKGDILEYFKS